MYASFLRAQAKSPVLSLPHTGIGDDGLLELAHFLVDNRHVKHLDLRGNGISATGVMHLAKVLKQNTTLESLVLMHNKIGENGDVGISILTESLLLNSTLKHLDLRHNSLRGEAACKHLGWMLKHNSCLTHLELSWNPLEPVGGHTLLSYLRDNSTLFDCQLTGCQLAEQTMQQIADVLHRNRRVRNASMQAGPYMARGLEDGLPSEGMPSDGDFVPVPKAPFFDEHSAAIADGGVAVSKARTAELLAQLATRQTVQVGSSPSASSSSSATASRRACIRKAHEAHGLLSSAARLAEEERVRLQDVREHMQLLSDSFLARERRCRVQMAGVQDKLLQYASEHRTMQGIRNRLSEELKLQKEIAQRAIDELEAERQQHEVDEARDRGQLQRIEFDSNALRKRLEDLESKCQRQEEESARLKERMRRCREDIILQLPRSTLRAEQVT